MTRYDTVFLHMEWTRSIGHRSNTLTTHISDCKNHKVLDNTILKRFYYVSDILDSFWLFSVSIASMEESCAGMKVDHRIFNRKTHIGAKRGEHPRV